MGRFGCFAAGVAHRDDAADFMINSAANPLL